MSASVEHEHVEGDVVQERDDLTRRIERLEREARRWRWAAVVLGGVLGIIGLVGATKAGLVPVAEEIRARRFVVVDSQGRERVLLGEDLLKGIGLRVLDADGIPRVVLGVKHRIGDIPYLSLIDKSPGWVRLSLELADDGSPSLQLFSPVVRDKPLTAGGGPNIARAEMSLGPDGSPVLYLRDQTTTPRVALGRMDLQVVKVPEKPSESLQRLGELRSPISSVVLFDEDGKVLFKAP